MTLVLAFALPIFVLAGAFMWMKPSPRDQYLARLRASSIGYGLRIDSLRVPDTTEFGRVNDKFQIVTLYKKTIIAHDEPHPMLTVLRTSAESGTYLPDGWQWEERSQLTDEHYSQLNGLLAGLPASITVLHIGTDSVGLSWDEKDENVTFERLCSIIEQAAAILGVKLI